MRRSSRSVRTRSTCPSSRKAVDGATVGRRLVSWNVSPSVQTGTISMSGEAASRVYTHPRARCTPLSLLPLHSLAPCPYTPYAHRCTPAEKRRCTPATRLHFASRQRLQRPVPLRFFRSCSHGQCRREDHPARRGRERRQAGSAPHCGQAAADRGGGGVPPEPCRLHAPQRVHPLLRRRQGRVQERKGDVCRP